MGAEIWLGPLDSPRLCSCSPRLGLAWLQPPPARGAAIPGPASCLAPTPLLAPAFPRDPNLLERYRRGLRSVLAQEVPIEIKPVNPPDFFHQNPQEPKQLLWVRARGHIGKTRDRGIDRVLLPVQPGLAKMAKFSLGGGGYT